MDRTSHPIVDKDSRVIAVLVGQPQDNAYHASARAAYDVIVHGGSAELFQQDKVHHRCVTFPALTVGVTHGQGTIRPMNFNTGTHTALATHLL